VPLFGPPAAGLLDPIPPADLVRALHLEIPELLAGLEDGDDTRNSLLTLARIWFTLETGRIESKDVAAAWALERLPEASGEALGLARAAYLGEAVDTWDKPARRMARADWDAIVAVIDLLTRT
jgi:streptomycin 3"-adenylyltransferase